MTELFLPLLKKQKRINGMALAFLLLFLPGLSLAGPEQILQLPDGENAILVEKKTQTLFVFSARDGRLIQTFKTACSTGEAAGIKQKAGDKKTPEGVYFLVDEYEDRYLTPVYGKKAFPTDYPNPVDRREGRNGSAIWIHGTNKALKPMDSNGCVALENLSILALAKYVNLHSTPVIMVQQLAEADPKKASDTRNQVQTLVEKWVKGLEKGSYHEYLSCYSSSFLPDMGFWRQWQTARKKAAENQSGFGLKIRNMGMYQTRSIVTVLFDCYLSAGENQVLMGKRKLFLNPETEGFKIIADSFQDLSKSLKKVKGHPLLAAAGMLQAPVSSMAHVQKTVDQWLAAWTAMDMDAYASFYSGRFRSDGLGKKQWVRRKRHLARTYDYIQVTGRDFKVRVKEKKAVVSFFQDYKSSGFETQGTKTLKLVYEGGLWKIYQESWKEK